MKNCKLVLLTLFALVTSVCISQAQLLNVNFDSAGSGNNFGGGEKPTNGPASGPGVIGSRGDIWNGVNTLGAAAFATSGPFTNADGSASPVTLSFVSSGGGAFDNNAPSFGTYSPFAWPSAAAETAGTGYPNSPYAVLFSDEINGGGSGALASVTISNLTANAAYTLFVYSAGNAAGRISSFWINNGPTNSSTYDNKTITLVSGVDYLEFSTSADANGNMTINFGGNADENDLNGFQLIAGSVEPATITSSAPLNGLTLCTNTSLTFTATSGSVGGLPSTTISAFTNVVKTSALGSLVTTSVTNVYTTNGTYASGVVVAGLGSSPATLNIPLPRNLKYSVSVTAVPASGPPLLTADTFDTFAPALVIEASDYNFNGGSWLETPANGGVWLDYNQPDPAVEDTDFRKTGGEGPAQFGAGDIFYRDISLGTTPPGDAPYVTPANADTFSEQKDAVATTGTTLGVNDFPELGVGYAGSGDWWNYTRTYGTSGYPVDSATNGTYNIWLYMAEGGAGGEQATLSSVPNPSIQSTNQTLTQLGQFGTGTFAENDWNGYEYVPLTDQYGNIVSTTIGSGKQTLQLQLGPGPNPNVGLLMLIPATPVLTPGLSFIYPNGQPFESTNVFNFTVTPNNGANVLTSGIDLVLNGVDVSSGLTITAAAGNTWKVSYPLQYNAVYTAVISITNTSALYSTFTYNFDTFNVNYYQWEAVDYDFSTNNGTGSTPPAQGGELYGGWVSGLFIDNPVPTADTTSTTASGPLGEEETNSYFGYPIDFTSTIDPFGAGAVAQQGVDINVTANGQGAGQALYRIGDTVGNQTSTDYLRPKFKAAQTKFNDPNIGLYNVGYIAAGNWFNYTRHYPAGSYNVFGRLANASPYSLALGQVTAGVGTGTQTVTPLGTFTGTNGAGYQAWQWIPLEDTNNHPVVVTLSGQATTFRATAGTGLNMEFFMLVPVFTITATTSGGNINISFPTQNTSSYQLLFKNSLTAPTWTPIGSPVSGNGSIESISQPTTGTMRFYSVQVE